MIQPFWGELGLVPVPLEVSHNYCSHKCAFCFANLNNPNRTTDVKKLTNQLLKYKQQKNFAALMLQKKLAVAVSNKTDPFARSNYKIAIPMLETLHNENIPVFMQTRGGFGMEEALAFMKPTLWYISITHTSEDTRKLIEPGGTSVAERWQLVNKLKSLGHKVLVACNPYHSFWIENDKFIEQLKEHRPDGLVLQLLHLNYKQISNMTDRERSNMGEKSLSIARKRNVDVEQLTKMMELHHAAIDLGIKVHNYNAPSDVNEAHEIYKEVYGSSIFNTTQGFIEHCRITKMDNDIVTFKEYITYMLDGNPFRAGTWDIKSYLTSQSKEFRNGVTMPTKMSYTDVFKIQWNDERARKLLNRINNFNILIEGEGDNEYLPTDRDGNIIYVWNSNGYSGEYTDFSNQSTKAVLQS